MLRTSIFTMSNRIDQEKETLREMVTLYCRHRLKATSMPEPYEQLVDYAYKRLERCRWGTKKPNCHQCRVHCYAPDKRQQVREIMKWAGPRMIIYAPIKAMRYLINSMKPNPTVAERANRRVDVPRKNS